MGKVDLKIDADIAAKAKAAGLDAVSVAESALRAAIAQTDSKASQAWTERNSEALQDHQDRIAAHGAFGEDLQTW